MPNYRKCCFSPKDWDNIAQGNALGEVVVVQEP